MKAVVGIGNEDDAEIVASFLDSATSLNDVIGLAVIPIQPYSTQ